MKTHSQFSVPSVRIFQSAVHESGRGRLVPEPYDRYAREKLTGTSRPRPEFLENMQGLFICHRQEFQRSDHSALRIPHSALK